MKKSAPNSTLILKIVDFTENFFKIFNFPKFTNRDNIQY